MATTSSSSAATAKPSKPTWAAAADDDMAARAARVRDEDVQRALDAEEKRREEYERQMWLEREREEEARQRAIDAMPTSFEIHVLNGGPNCEFNEGDTLCFSWLITPARRCPSGAFFGITRAGAPSNDDILAPVEVTSHMDAGEGLIVLTSGNFYENDECELRFIFRDWTTAHTCSQRIRVHGSKRDSVALRVELSCRPATAKEIDAGWLDANAQRVSWRLVSGDKSEITNYDTVYIYDHVVDADDFTDYTASEYATGKIDDGLFLACTAPKLVMYRHYNSGEIIGRALLK